MISSESDDALFNEASNPRWPGHHPVVNNSERLGKNIGLLK